MREGAESGLCFLEHKQEPWDHERIMSAQVSVVLETACAIDQRRMGPWLSFVIYQALGARDWGLLRAGQLGQGRVVGSKKGIGLLRAGLVG